MTTRIIQGDCLDVLRTLPDQSINCCVTSPPYWGLRDYGVAGQLGLESTPQEYVEKMVAVFRDVRRVLRDDGTLWLNLGSSYARAAESNVPQTKKGGTPFYPEHCKTGSSDGAVGRGDRPGTRNGASGGSDPIRSLQRSRVPACGNDGTELQDSTGADLSCHDLCDGCLADFLNHRERTVGTVQPTSQSEQQLLQTIRDTAPLDSASAFPAASLPDVQESNTLESWLQHRGECSRCASRASSLATLHSFLPGAQASVRSLWMKYSTRFKQKDMVPIP